jgi:parallel beta-helix repeat protein
MHSSSLDFHVILVICSPNLNFSQGDNSKKTTRKLYYDKGSKMARTEGRGAKATIIEGSRTSYSDDLRGRAPVRPAMALKLVGLAIGLFLLLFVAYFAYKALSGTTYYVSPTGSDSNSCSQASPCATPDHAFSIASPGDTVQVAAGTYDYGNNAAQFAKSGAVGKPITVTCAARGACKIQNSVSDNTTVVLLGGSYINFNGFEVTNTNPAGNNLGLYVTAPFVNITHNTIHHIETDCGPRGGGGIKVAEIDSMNSYLHDITIDGNLIYDISYRDGSPSCPASTVQTDGILAQTAGTGIRITNNIVHHTSGGWGIFVGDSNATNNGYDIGSVISNNTIFSTAMGGIILMSGNGTTISNNIVLNTGHLSGRCGINAPQGVAITYANNDLWKNAGGNYCIEWGGSDQKVHSNDISVDPALGTTFINWKADGSGDYHERAGSPTIDAGSSSVASPASDFDGIRRPQGARHDIGAYEYPN